MNPSADCRRLAEVLREQANEIHDAEQKAKYEKLIRGFLLLARQFEQDTDRARATVRRRERLVNFIVLNSGSGSRERSAFPQCHHLGSETVSESRSGLSMKEAIAQKWRNRN